MLECVRGAGVRMALPVQGETDKRFNQRFGSLSISGAQAFHARLISATASIRLYFRAVRWLVLGLSGRFILPA